MLYKYSVCIRLEYNKYALNKYPDSEFRAVLKKTYEKKYDRTVIAYDLPEAEKRVIYNCSYKIKVYNTYSEKYNKSMTDDFFLCEIDGVLAENKESVYRLIEKQIEAICMELTFVVNRYNTNRHQYQPRIEPNWMSARWKQEECQPYLIKDTQVIEKEIIDEKKYENIHFKERVNIGASVYSTFIQTIPADELNPELFCECANIHYKDLQFIARQYYIALGEESFRSKYFQLFSIIEYIENKYINMIAVSHLYTEDEVNNLLDLLKKELSGMKNVSREDKGKSISVIKKDLMSATVQSRAEKLLMILSLMGVVEYEAFGKKELIDTKMLRNLISLRNKLFHGGIDRENDNRRYRDGILQLLFICEGILEYMKKE